MKPIGPEQNNDQNQNPPKSHIIADLLSVAKDSSTKGMYTRLQRPSGAGKRDFRHFPTGLSRAREKATRIEMKFRSRPSPSFNVDNLRPEIHDCAPKRKSSVVLGSWSLTQFGIA